jgi:hypothetical protein
MKNLIYILFAIAFASESPAQSFGDYLATLPKLTLPVKFNDDSYLALDLKELPTKFFAASGVNLSLFKALAKIEVDNCYIVLVKKYYNDGNDYLIMGLVYGQNGTFFSKKPFDISSDGEDVDFSITFDFKVKILNSGGITGILKTYVIENGSFRQIGETESIEDVDEYVQDN